MLRAILGLVVAGELIAAPAAAAWPWAWADVDGDRVVERVEVRAKGEVRVAEEARVGKLVLEPMDVLSAVDVDQDHDLDLVLWQPFGTGKRKLWVNEGSGRFARRELAEAESFVLPSGTWGGPSGESGGEGEFRPGATGATVGPLSGGRLPERDWTGWPTESGRPRQQAGEAQTRGPPKTL